MSKEGQPSVLITGCSKGGAGNALALEFASKGYRVFATARSQKTLSNLKDKGIETLVLDVTSSESIGALKDEITSRTGGRLDVLFNNAGTPSVASNRSRNKTPTIINVASVLARLPNPFSSAYNASKAAVASYSDTLRLELQPLGVKVVTLYMGEVSTPLMATENINFGAHSLYRDVEEAVKARTTTHLEKTMQPAEFARQVVASVIHGKDAFMWKGSNAFVVWLLNAVGPRKVFDSVMLKNAGLHTTEAKSSVYKLGQKWVGKAA
ncbi:hypothetical protein FDECE_9385 [Fusarium decemcellulare]|nr:hypothetical protein FDECE_9385 [Fusarium decemcellulare]